MSKVFGIHTIALHPGVKEDDFENFVRKELSDIKIGDGRNFLLKGDRGDRKGKYLLMIEFPSQQSRDQSFPTEGGFSPEIQAAMVKIAPVLEKWASMATPIQFTVHTDYVVIE